MATILPIGKTQFLDANGDPLAGGTIDFYIPNTSTRKDTYQDSDQTVVNSNPVVLDAAGRAVVYGSGSYRQVLKDAAGNQIFDVLTAETVVSSLSAGGTSTGSANAQVVSAGVFSFLDGQTIVFTAGYTNTGAMTLQVGSASAIAVVKNSSSGPVDLAAGDITAGNAYLVSYSATNGNFQLLQSIPPVITIASQAEAEAGTNNTDMMTPLRAAQAISYQITSPLAATTSGKGASLVGIQDAGSHYTGTTVEAALQEAALAYDGELISSWSHSTDVASIAFSNLSIYQKLKLIFANMNSTGPTMIQLSTDNGATWITTGYYSFAADDSSGTSWDSGLGLMQSGSSWGGAYANAGIVEIEMFNTAGAYAVETGVVMGTFKSSGRSPAAVAYNAMRIQQYSGTITAGQIFLLGWRART